MLRLDLAVLCAAVASLTVAACSRAPESSRHSFTVAEENGVTVARSTGPPKYQGDLFAYDKVLEIRPDPGNRESFLYQPSFFTMDEAGFLFVGDSRNGRIAVFDPEGTYVRSIGRRGEGPGEFQFGPDFPINLHEGILSTHMTQSGTTVRFGTDGTYLGALPRSVPNSLGIHQAGDGSLVVHEQLMETDHEYERWGKRMTVFDVSGTVLVRVETEMTPVAVMVSVPGQSYPEASTIQFGGQPQTIYLATEEILVSNGEEPILNWYGLDGVLRRQVRLDLPRESVTAEEKDKVEAPLDRLASENPDRSALYREMRDSLHFPEFKAYWSWALADDAGYIWLGKARGEWFDYTSDASLEFRVLSPEGEYLGDTTWPPLDSPSGIVIVRSHLLGMVTDPETGEVYPTVFRIRSAIEGYEYPE